MQVHKAIQKKKVLKKKKYLKRYLKRIVDVLCSRNCKNFININLFNLYNTLIPTLQMRKLAKVSQITCPGWLYSQQMAEPKLPSFTFNQQDMLSTFNINPQTGQDPRNRNPQPRIVYNHFLSSPSPQQTLTVVLSKGKKMGVRRF